METAAGPAPARSTQRQIASSSSARAARLREHSLRATAEAGSGHPTSCLSAADLVAALFFDVMRYDPTDPGNHDLRPLRPVEGTRRAALYAAWAEAGALPVERLLTLRRIDSELEGHPTPRFAGYRRGDRIARAGTVRRRRCGVAYKRKQVDGRDQRVYVLLGDGEMAEGSVWEAAEIAAHYQLDNLVAIVDVNGLGQSQRTMYGHDIRCLPVALRSLRLAALAIDGHDMAAIVPPSTRPARCAASRSRSSRAPTRGKGVSFLEDKDNWHGKPLKKGEELDKAIAEVRAARAQVEPCARSRPAAGAARARSRPPGAMPAPQYKADDQVATREAYGTALAKLGGSTPLVDVLDADTKNSTFAERFLAAYPERFLEGFIAEQNMVGAAVGLVGARARSRSSPRSPAS